MSNQSNIAISTLLSFILLSVGANFWSAIGLGLTLFYTLKIINEMGNKLPIIDLMTAIASLQWILGPFIDYHTDVHHYKYHMYVNEIEYMSFLVPAIISFRIGISFFKDHSNLEDIGGKVKHLLFQYPRLPYFLIAGGFIIPYVSSFFPASLRFAFFLLSNVKYIGITYLLFSDHPNRWPIFWGTITFTAIASIALGMFHDLLLWGMLLFTFVAKEKRYSFTKKISIAIVAAFLAITIQSVKASYRQKIWYEGYSGNKVTLFLSLAVQEWNTGSIFTPSSDEDINNRLNQGWIISAIMKNVTENQSFANGETIWEGISSSLLPRFLAPEKAKAGGRENFKKFTGLHIDDNTSMGISIVGEGYANYGYFGGIFFMFFWGLFIGWFWHKIQNWSSFYPTLLIWSPILFLQVIKAETEFVVVLNHLVKATLLILGLLWLIKRRLGIRI